jgi:hypothetical protein
LFPPYQDFTKFLYELSNRDQNYENKSEQFKQASNEYSFNSSGIKGNEASTPSVVSELRELNYKRLYSLTLWGYKNIHYLGNIVRPHKLGYHNAQLRSKYCLGELCKIVLKPRFNLTRKETSLICICCVAPYLYTATLLQIAGPQHVPTNALF